jgi:adenylosuccinate synthase
LPSGTLANSDAALVLGAGAVISVERLQKEVAELAIDFQRLIIDPQAMIIDPADVAFEQRGLKDEIASTARGVGSATARKVLRGKEFNVELARDVPQLKHYIHDTVDYFANALQEGKRILLEGTQGTLLSIHHGFYPHVTSRVTTATGCLAEAGIPVSRVRRIIMVCRTYPIRVGDTDTGNTSGKMSQVIDLETVAARSGLSLDKLQQTERTSTTNRKRRIAEFDWLMFRRALTLNGPTDIALTFVDYLSKTNQDAFRYEQLTVESQRFVEEIEQVSKVPVSLISTRFGERNIIDRRTW